jgi:hypothetical protein
MGVMARVGVCVGIAGMLVLSLLAATSPASAQSALLDPTASRVTLARDGTMDDVTAERVIRSGDTVATDVTGRAVVTYPDGSTATLEESSELTIDFIRTSAGDYVVRMRQTLGRVWYAVTRTVASSGRYEVHSGAMASVIRAGSGSLVSVTDSGTTVVPIDGTAEATIGAPVDGPRSLTQPSSFADAPNATPRPTTFSNPTSASAPTTGVTATPTPNPTTTTATVTVALPAPGPTIAIHSVIPSATPVPAPTKDVFGPRKDEPGKPVLPPKGATFK